MDMCVLRAVKGTGKNFYLICNSASNYYLQLQVRDNSSEERTILPPTYPPVSFDITHDII